MKRKSRRERIRRHYEPRISPLREHHEILDWATADSQRARFAVLVDNLDLAGRSLLDVGCGLGDLWAYLKQRDVAVEYTGVDLLEGMAARARELHPDGRFVCADIFAANPFGPEAFDVVFASGTFNLKLGNDREFLAVALERLFELSRRHVVFNLLHVRARQRFGHCCYHDPADVQELLKRYACRVRLLDDYLFNDFTLICEKPTK